MAIKKIGEFVSAVPTSEDKILFEHNESGKSCSIEDAVNACSLTYTEITSGTDLSGKVASADALLRRTVVETPYSATFSTNEYAIPFTSLAVINTNIDYLDVIAINTKDMPCAYTLRENNGKCTIYVYGNQHTVGLTRDIWVRHFKQE